MSAFADFLTTRSLRILVGPMRRNLRIRAAFEPTRPPYEPLVDAYEKVLPTRRSRCALNGSLATDGASATLKYDDELHSPVEMEETR